MARPKVIKKLVDPETIIGPKLTLKQEMFCQLYTKNRELFGNATLSYAIAYNYNLEELSHDREKTKKGKEIPGTSEYEKAYSTCSVGGHRMLTNNKINDRVTVLLNELMEDSFVDSELARLITQDRELNVKASAIKEYNRLRQRVIEKHVVDFNEVSYDKAKSIISGRKGGN